MKNKYITITIFLLLALSSCVREELPEEPTPIPPAKETPTPTPLREENTPQESNPVFADMTDFESGINAYRFGFVNYPENKEETFNLFGQLEDIPNLSSKGIHLSGSSQDENLIMYLTKGIIFLANTEYVVTLDFDIATNIKSNLAEQKNPMEQIYIKAGVNNIPFTPVIDNDGYYRSNWNIGKMNTSGPDGMMLGTAEKINSDDDTYQYKHFSQEFRLVTTEEGLISVLLAADTSLASLSSIYFDNIIIEIAEQ